VCVCVCIADLVETIVFNLDWFFYSFHILS